MKNKLEITSEVSLDEIRNALLTDLTDDQIIEFFLSLGEDIENQEEFYRKIRSEADLMCEKYE